MWNQKKVSIGIITKDNGSTIRGVIEDVFYTGFVDDVVVADIGSKDRTVSEISYTKARILSAKDYVDAFNQIMGKSLGLYVIFINPSGLIPGTEISKVLPYSRDCTAVFTSRLTWLGSPTLQSDKKFSKYNLKLGAKISSQLDTVLFNDVNSMFFMLDKETAKHDEFKFLMPKEFFVFEIMMNSFRQGLTHIQIPCEFHSSLSETDNKLFSSPMNYFKMKKVVSSLKNSFKRKMKIKYEDNSIVEDVQKDDENNIDSFLIKKRITELRKKLGATDDSLVSPEVKEKLDKAVKKIVRKSKTKNSGKKYYTLEEEYKILENLEVGLKKSNASKKKKNTKRNPKKKTPKNF